MRRTTLLLVCALAATLSLRLGMAEPWIPPDNRLEFTIAREGDEIGRQTLAFSRDGARLVVDTRVEIRVKRFFVTVHRFERSARSVWQDGLLQSYTATTDNNGEKSSLNVAVSGDALTVVAQGHTQMVPRALKVSELWNVDIMSENSVINTVTGEVNEIAVSGPEMTSLELGGRTIPARRYRMSGRTTREIWYDEKGGLLQISRKARDGSTVVTRRR